MSKIAWNDINWTLVQNRISRQQRRVYKASAEGNRAKVHAIQRRIIISLDAKLLAVRYVTTENKGLSTVGVNKVKLISQKKNIELAYRLKLDGKPSPIRNIRKTSSSEFGKSISQPLSILTIEEQAKQMLAKLALEPEWEAIFEANSYGFRPGKSCYDATYIIYFSLREKSQYILNFDIQNCFDTMDHIKLLNKLATFNLMKNQIKGWLKAGIMVGYFNRPDQVISAIQGTPKISVISPLLANITLHGLGDHIKNWYISRCYLSRGRNPNLEKQDHKTPIQFSRYGDKFIIIVPDRVDMIEIKKQILTWLENEAGLELSKLKIKLVNSSEGFEFLGFQIISIKRCNGDYNVKIYPSRRSRAYFIEYTRDIIQKNKSVSSFYLINLLNTRIINWANYFQYSECNLYFSKIDYLIFNQVKSWVFRRKSKGLKCRRSLKLKYFPEGKSYYFRGKIYKNNWILVGKSLTKSDKVMQNFLFKMTWIGSTQYIKMKRKVFLYDDHSCQNLQKYALDSNTEFLN